jgi:hypothetical protein
LCSSDDGDYAGWGAGIDGDISRRGRNARAARSAVSTPADPPNVATTDDPDNTK